MLHCVLAVCERLFQEVLDQPLLSPQRPLGQAMQQPLHHGMQELRWLRMAAMRAGLWTSLACSVARYPF